MTTAHGLVIGKFLLPHDGHRMLIHAASAASSRLTVLVLANAAEPIALADRVAWLAEAHESDVNVTVVGVHDDLPVDYDDAGAWEQHVALYTSAIANVTDEPVTAVFSSEAYGAELARRLGAVDVVIDAGRELVPISSTELRSNSVRLWEHLAVSARGACARRVVVIGAESTGKTTLSLAITDALRSRGGSHGLTRWVPEHGRDFTIDKLAAARATAIVDGRQPPAMDALQWTSDEFTVIAARQNELEDEAARIGGPVLICDTDADAFATGIWHERYQGFASPEADALARHHPLYLVTHHDDVPFEQDGIRDGEAVRAWMTGRFLDALEATGRRYIVVRGSREERLARSLAAIDDLLAEPL